MMFRRFQVTLPLLFSVLGFIVGFTPYDCTAQSARSDVLRIYWDTGFSEVLTAAAVGDTVTAYVVLENPSLNGNLSEFRLYFQTTIAPVIGFASPLGTIVDHGNRYYRILPNPDTPLADRMLVATFQIAVTTLAVDAVALWGESYQLVGASDFHSCNYPYYFTIDSAWLNPGEPQVDFALEVLEFGEHGYNRSTNQSVMITNSGSAPLFLTPGFLPESANFEILNSEFMDVISTNQSKSLQLVFSPDTIGEFSGSFTLGSGVDLALHGTGREPIYSLSAPDTLVFAETAVGHHSDAYVVFENRGDYTFTLLPEFTTPCATFSSGYLYSAEIPPDSEAYVSIVFSPTETGSSECEVTFADGLVSVHLIGSGREPVAAYVIDADSLDFGYTAPEEPVTRYLRVSNTGETIIETDLQIVGGEGAFQLDVSSPQLVIPRYNSQQIGVAFQPETTGEYRATLVLGGGLPDIPLMGTSTDYFPVVYGETPTLYFEPTNPGETHTRIVRVFNPASTSRTIAPTTTSSLILDMSPGGVIGRGQSMDISVTYRPYEYGRFEFKIMLNEDQGIWFNCVGTPRLDFTAEQNRVGFFFDANYAEIDRTITAEPQAVTAHLVMNNPTSQSGIGGWECQVRVSEGASLVGADLAGNTINASEGNEFTVGLGLAPLVYGTSVLLGTFEFVVWDMSQTEFRLDLLPTTHSSIPGMMSWVPWDNVTHLTPMLPFTGQPTVAWIRSNTTVATETPTPHLVPQSGGIDLSWPNSAPTGAGYHVYRRHDTNAPQRLTSEPLVATTETVVYHDEPTDITNGTLLHYSYRTVINGQEIGQSPEVDWQFESLLPRTTRLKTNVPNPFNPQTRIRFDLAHQSHVLVNIYDVTGRRVRQLENSNLTAGPYELIWAGRDDHGQPLSSGAYYVRLVTDKTIDSRKIMLLK